MNVGDKLYASGLSGNQGYMNYGGANFTHYFYVIGSYTANNNCTITADTAVEQSQAETYIEKWVSGSWVGYWGVVSSGGQGYVAGSYCLTDGYWRIRASDYYGYSSYTLYRSMNAARRQGYKIRTILSDFSAYNSAGANKIYAADVNVGQVCTY